MGEYPVFATLQASRIKRVLALAGTTVCRNGATIVAYGHAYGQARDGDRIGRPPPAWQGCRTLPDSEVFLMNGDANPRGIRGRNAARMPSG
ncbi:MAG TPA: S26 family signal peptidase [Rhizobiaceae bacterium]|nr:S26 family signal peptidase [Rhizobiaceae bacterium]